MTVFEDRGVPDLAMQLELILRSYDGAPSELRPEIVSLFRAAPALFLGVLFRWFTQPGAESLPSCRYAAKIAVENCELARILTDANTLPPEEALLLAECAARVAPGFDTALLKQFLATHCDNAPPETLLRLLDIVSRIDTVGRTNSFLMQFLRDENPHVRSRVTMLLIRSTRNSAAASAWLNDADQRVRANVLEGLWPDAQQPRTRKLFRMHCDSQTPRVAVNALIGLSLGGERDAASLLIQRLETPNETMQRAAAWGMGYLALPEFEAPLRRALRSKATFMRQHVLRALVSINRKRQAADAATEQQAGQPDFNPAVEDTLRSGREVWARWRAESQDTQPNLDYASLQHTDLTGVDLSYCSLRGANLAGARLNFSSLFGADLRGANLQGAQLCRADLRAAAFDASTNCSRANFHGASLYGLDLEDADFQDARFGGADPAITAPPGAKAPPNVAVPPEERRNTPGALAMRSVHAD